MSLNVLVVFCVSHATTFGFCPKSKNSLFTILCVKVLVSWLEVVLLGNSNCLFAPLFATLYWLLASSVCIISMRIAHIPYLVIDCLQDLFFWGNFQHLSTWGYSQTPSGSFYLLPSNTWLMVHVKGLGFLMGQKFLMTSTIFFQFFLWT